MGLETGTYVSDLVLTNPVGGTDSKGQGDDHLRLIKTVLQNTFPLAVGVRKFRDDDAGAADTLTWTLYRKSASPAANDLLGSYAITGNNASAVEKVYARWQARIDDATAGSEDGSWIARTMVAGAETYILTIGGTGIALAADKAIYFSGTGAATTRANLGISDF